MTEKQLEARREFVKQTGEKGINVVKYLQLADYDLEKAITLWRDDLMKSMKRFGAIMDG